MYSESVVDDGAPLVTKLTNRHRWERGLRTSLFVAFCALLMFGPLALGVVQNWSIALFEASAAIILLIWMAWYLTAVEIRMQWNPLFAPMLVFFCVVLVQIAFHRSAYLYDSLAELWFCIAYGILAFVAAQLLEADYIVLFGKTMVLFGSIYALFAVFQGFTSNGRIYRLIKPRAGSIYGSYVNHNHYAGLMELVFPFALVLALDGSVRAEKRILPAFAAIAMAASVFLSQSRGGMTAVIIELVFLGIVWMVQFSPRKSAAVVATICVVTAVFLAWIAPQELGSRISDIHDPARLLIHRDSIRMLAAHPFLGSGFGTFPEVFPHYRVFYDGFFINHAHDDYLELLLETGLIGFGVAIWFIVVLYHEGIRNLRRANFSPTARISTAALTACTGLLAHSFMDFNLHIPANAALFYVMCAVATAPSGNRHRSTCSDHRARVGQSEIASSS